MCFAGLIIAQCRSQSSQGFAVVSLVFMVRFFRLDISQGSLVQDTTRIVLRIDIDAGSLHARDAFGPLSRTWASNILRLKNGLFVSTFSSTRAQRVAIIGDIKHLHPFSDSILSNTSIPGNITPIPMLERLFFIRSGINRLGARVTCERFRLIHKPLLRQTG